MKIPSLLLKQLYNYSSLRNLDGGVQFSLKNRLNDVVLQQVQQVRIDSQEIPPDSIELVLDDGRIIHCSSVKPDNPLAFPLRSRIYFRIPDLKLSVGVHDISLSFKLESYDDVVCVFTDSIAEREQNGARVPYDKADNFSPEIIAKRHQYAQNFTGIQFQHIKNYSFDPKVAAHNIENFFGVAQVPIGLAGPIKVNGEHAQGEFIIPLATSEGTLVASYNRGMKVLNLCGGVTCTVSEDCMQRAPVFGFDNAREARDFSIWLYGNIEHIREIAESTSSVAKFMYIDTYLSNKFAFLRFNFSTGDAAGQNMVGRATFVACSWILDQPAAAKVRSFYLESNFATDKKSSQVNILKTRGKRVTAEGVVKRAVLEQHMRVRPETLLTHANIANVGAMLSGAINNGAQSPNAITAMFIATGQDVANVSESSAGVYYSELTADGDLYISLTIPSLIVATHGGGTGLPTQTECLEILGCRGKGKVYKLAEIIAAVALAGELSLGSAISSMDWVSSHERYGRNR